MSIYITNRRLLETFS